MATARTVVCEEDEGLVAAAEEEEGVLVLAVARWAAGKEEEGLFAAEVAARRRAWLQCW